MEEDLPDMASSERDIAWQEKVEQLRLALLEQRESLPAAEVTFRWWTPPKTYIPMFSEESFSETLRFFRGEDRSRVVAIFRKSIHGGNFAFLVFEASPHILQSRSGVAKGILIGDAVPGGAVCLELEEKVIWPAAPPQCPDRRTPRL